MMVLRSSMLSYCPLYPVEAADGCILAAASNIRWPQANRTSISTQENRTTLEKKKKTEEFWHGVLLVVRFAPAADVLLLYQVYWTCGV